jgi:hypothetical protein
MNKILYLLATALSLSACGANNSKETAVPEAQTATTPATPVRTLSPQLDSIDKANNESVMASGDQVTRAFVSLKERDSTITLVPNMRQDHRFFGYAKPDVTSERLILLSIFTNDVENNPFGCQLGAYYGTSNLENIQLKYTATEGNFVKAVAVDKGGKATTLYFEKKWIELM